ncbi:sugar transferase [Blastococcus sp. SYSU DS0973]
MRRSKSFSRALSHPSGDTIRRRVAAPAHPTAAAPVAGPVAGPPAPRREPVSAGATDAVRDVLSDVGAVVLVTGGVLEAAGAVSLLTGSATPHGFVLLGGGLALAGVLLQRRQVADRVLAAVVGTVLLPALLVIALAVRFSGPGPILVRQARPDGDPQYPALRFRIARTASAPEDRPTRVGGLLRSLSLDELPSLLDSVRGDLPFLCTGSRRAPAPHGR